MCKRNVPIAEIRPVPLERASERPIGLAKGKLQLPPEFFEPLAPDVLEAFYGEFK